MKTGSFPSGNAIEKAYARSSCSGPEPIAPSRLLLTRTAPSSRYALASSRQT